MQEYKFQHITDLALVDDADIDQLCSELPKMIRQLKETKAAIDLMCEAGILQEQPVASWMPFITWRNDGEDTITMDVREGDTSLGKVVIE